VIFGLSVAEILTSSRSMANPGGPHQRRAGLRVATGLEVPPPVSLAPGCIAVFALLAGTLRADDEQSYRRDFSFGIRAPLFLTVPAALIMYPIPARSHCAAAVPHDGRTATRLPPALVLVWLGILPLSALLHPGARLYARRNTMTAVWVGLTTVLDLRPRSPCRWAIGWAWAASRWRTSFANWRTRPCCLLLSAARPRWTAGDPGEPPAQLVPGGAFAGLWLVGAQVCTAHFGTEAPAKLLNSSKPMGRRRSFSSPWPGSSGWRNFSSPGA